MPLQTPVKLMFDLETAILEKVVRLLVSGDNETYSQQWQLDKMRDLGILNTEVQAVIKKYAKIINEKTYDDIDQTAKNILSEIQAVLPDDMKVASSPIITDAINKWVASAQGDLNYSLAKMAEGANQAYVTAINKAALQVITGQSTLQSAIRQAVTETANKGLPAYVDRAGRTWSPEGYTQMVLRTNQARTADAVMFDTARQLETDRFEVSSHIGARPLCAPYQGRIFTMQELQNETSYGKAAGLRGVNCGHVLYPFVPGMKQTFKPYPEARNEQVYKESQEQRYLERSIRNSKRKADINTKAAEAAQSPEEKAKFRATADRASQSVKDYQAQLRDFIDSTDRTRRYDREQIYTTTPATTKPPSMPKTPDNYMDINYIPKTTKEASEWAVKNISSIKGADYGDIDVKTVNIVNQTLYDTVKKYPELENNLQYVGTYKTMRKMAIDNYIKEEYDVYNRGKPSDIKTWKDQGKTDSQILKLLEKQGEKHAPKYDDLSFATATSGLSYVKGIAINDKYSDFEKLSKELKAVGESGWITTGTIKGLTDHEIGHILDNTFFFSSKSDFRDKIKGKNLKGRLSGYPAAEKGETKYREALAEIWSEYQNSDNPKPLSQEIGENIERDIKKLRGE